MAERSYFRFQIPAAPKGPLIALTYQEAEQLLLKKLDDPTEDQTQVLWQLAHFYKINQQHEKALERLRQLMQQLSSPEDKAQCVFTMGQAMEQVGDFVTAARYYREAYALEPASTFTWYFINNNLGYCLNQTGQFADSEISCRRAIQIDPNRPNGHKNLGLALTGQGRYADAARAFIAATQANAADPRAFHHLTELLREHPELEFDFQSDLACCRQAVEFAGQKLQASRPIVYHGWRKQWILCTGKLKSAFRRLFRKPHASVRGPS